MAGVKGRSGGARKGAGRKPRSARLTHPAVASSPVSPPTAGQTPITDAKAFLEGVLAGRVRATEDQLNAAKALLPFQHKKLGETGKKEQRTEDAGKVSRFAPAPPRMAALGAKKH